MIVAVVSVPLWGITQGIEDDEEAIRSIGMLTRGRGDYRSERTVPAGHPRRSKHQANRATGGAIAESGGT